MPFTLSHPAAVVYGARSDVLIPSALVAGSMAPDFEYFMTWSFENRFGHSPAGVWLFSLPAGLVAWIFYRRQVLPFLRRAAGVDRTDVPESRLQHTVVGLRAAVSVILGILSHLALDSATHITSRFVLRVPLLRMQLSDSFLGVFHGCDLLQILFSLAGLLVAGVWLADTVHHLAKRFGPGIRHACASALAFALLAGLPAFLLGTAGAAAEWLFCSHVTTLRDAGGQLILISGTCFTCIGAAIVLISNHDHRTRCRSAVTHPHRRGALS